jgi:Cu-processing system ATP-binding protein
MTTPIAQWRSVSRHYGKVTAVRDVSLDLQPGEATALVGHNGAGKTTLIKLLLGLILPSSGSVRVLDADPAGRQGAEARSALGFLPENVAFHGAMTGSELMAFYARLKRQPRKHNSDLLALVGLSHAADRRVSTYSKGMRQRLGLAQTLIGRPRLLLLDEPTSGLDPASRIEVFDMIDRFRSDGATVLVSTHALAEIGDRVDRVAIMHHGGLLASGTMAELRSRSSAEVRLRVRVRPCTTGKVLELLPSSARCISRGETHLELALPALDKMAALRAISGPHQVEDIEVSTPGLEEVYRALIAGQESKP